MIGVDWIPIGACDIQSYTETEKAALAILNDGKSYFHISYKLHVSFERAREIVFSIRKKESLIMGKLTDQQKAEIYQKWKDGQAPKALAAEYNVSDQSIYNLVNKMNAQTELEDVENGIPNTPLVPAEIEKEIAAIAEEKSENADEKSEKAEPDMLPHYIYMALDYQIDAVNLKIEQREQRIAELKEEIANLENWRSAIQSWMGKQIWQ